MSTDRQSNSIPTYKALKGQLQKRRSLVFSSSGLQNTQFESSVTLNVMPKKHANGAESIILEELCNGLKLGSAFAVPNLLYRREPGGKGSIALYMVQMSLAHCFP